MKKRIVSFLMAVLMGLGTVPLSACGSKETVSRGQLLALICENFGMYTYIQEEPYLASVGADDPYFSVVQASVEWGVVSPEDQDYDVDAAVTRGELALAVVNAAELAAEDSSDEEKIAVAAREGLVEAKSDGSVKESAKVEPEEVNSAVVKAADLWANKTYDTPVEEIEYAEGVKDYGEITDYRVEGDKIYIPVSSGADIQPGDVYILGAQSAADTASAEKAQSVEEVDGYYVITNSGEELELEEALANYQSQATISPDFLNDCVILGPDGQPVTLSTDDAGTSASSASPQNLGLFKSGSLKFTAPDKSEISVSISSSSFSIKYKKPVNDYLSVNGAVEVSNVKITNDVDFSWLGKLKKATLKVDYTTKLSGGGELKAKIPDLVFAPYNNGNGGFAACLRNAFKDLKENGPRTENGKGATEIKICTIQLAGGKLAGLSLEVKLKVGLSGSATVSVTIAGSKGVEYKNGSLRYIKTNNTDWDFNIKGTLEITPYIGLKLSVLKIKVASAGIAGGVGAEFGVTVHLADSENHLIEELSDDFAGDYAEKVETAALSTTKSVIAEVAAAQGGKYVYESDTEVQLHADVCGDVTFYGILKIEIEDDCLVGKLLGNKIKLSMDILNKKNATFAHWHLEGWKNVGECTRSYTPFDMDDIDEEIEEILDEEKAQQGDTGLDLGAYTISLEPGGQLSLEITALPDGAGTGDLTFTSADTGVATVDSQGVVTGVAEGTTTITVSLKSDPSVTVQCAVFVGAGFSAA